MLKTLSEARDIIESGKCLHISGSEELLRQLPVGNWIGGSTEYFMSEFGGITTADKLFVQEFVDSDFKICVYDKDDISNITKDAFDNGFSIVVLPFDSDVHKAYAQKAPQFKDIFLKNIVGWIAGTNLSKQGQSPVAADGWTVQLHSDKAVVMHIMLPAERTVNVGIINIFTPDENSPVIEFYEDSFSAVKCMVDGKERVLSEYLDENNIDTRLPLVGSCFGADINISFKQIDDESKTVNFYAPVFSGIKYRIANEIPDYSKAFEAQLKKFSDIRAVFSCNCILNFLYGNLEGKKTAVLHGPITFGEVAYQLVNQTLVYVVIS